MANSKHGAGASDQKQPAPPRRMTCARCGAVFACGLGGDCWCAAEAYRLRMPAAGEDCICPACLRGAAGADDIAIA